VVIEPYEFEEQEGAIINAVRHKRLRKCETRMYTKMYFRLLEQDWCVINNAILLCDVDCQEDISELRAGDNFSYLVDETTVISNGQHPVAIVTDTKGRRLYVSPGYRMAIGQAEPE